MADIRINDLPNENNPVASEKVAIDGATTRGTTIQKLVDSGAPVASQAEAEAGANNVKRMTPLRAKQYVDAQVGVSIASAAQGALAATAVQPEDLGTSAPLDVGTTAGTVAAGDDERIVLGGTAVQPEELGTAAAENIEFFAQQSHVGSPDGIAPLGADSKVPLVFLPSVPFDIGGTIHEAEEKTNIVDADLFALSDSADLWTLKKLSWSALRTKVLEAVKSMFGASGVAPVFAARAWVNFNGIGTVAIRSSGNVSSITDNGVGNYTINFATALPNANYSVVATIDAQLDFTAIAVTRAVYTSQPLNTASSCRILTGYVDPSTSAKEDMRAVNVAIFG